jgi:hypothetical protein
MDCPIKIKVSSGPTYQPMILSLREFNATREDFLDAQRIEEVDGDSDRNLKIVLRKALPLGLPLSDVILLKRQCLQHIRSILSSSRNSQEKELGETSVISSKVLAAVERYRISSRAGSAVSNVVLPPWHGLQIDTLSRTLSSKKPPCCMPCTTSWDAYLSSLKAQGLKLVRRFYLFQKLIMRSGHLREFSADN